MAYSYEMHAHTIQSWWGVKSLICLQIGNIYCVIATKTVRESHKGTKRKGTLGFSLSRKNCVYFPLFCPAATINISNIGTGLDYLVGMFTSYPSD